MALLDRLEKRFRKYGIPNVTLAITFGQGLIYFLSRNNPLVEKHFALIPERVLDGEIWRLFTFIFEPPATHPVFLFFALYLFYLMGSALENFWGDFRYNVFLLIGYVATVAASFAALLFGAQGATSAEFIGGSVFLAFATLNPNFELVVFFILPVKIKWLALLTWLTYGFLLLFGDWLTRMLILASISNYLVFFGRDIALRMRSGRWRMERQAREFSRRNETAHRCVLCGVTEKERPDMTFRYCTKCAGTPCYCQEHIKNHAHVPQEK